MTILPLPEITTRILGSTLVLSNACSVIKELVDNALDAQATSIIIELSANTLDVIQVKDNGSGIGVEDRQLLCKRGCTSKIETLEDLDLLGGRSLGFRGEALASIVELSECLTITTRVEGELVASALKFGPNSKLLSSASASQSVGTTVRVQNFLTSIPVRKQAAAKASAKTLTEIKKLLCNYAFARPTIRFSLKVLKGKLDKANWSFAPCNGKDQLFTATAQLVGKEVSVSTQDCSIDSADTIDSQGSKSGFKLHALLLQPSKSGVSATHNVGQYISVDSRPLNTERSTAKELAKVYRSYLQHSIDSDSKLSTKPFFCLHITCPPGVYDVNVEPAKDEVLFHKPEDLVILFKKLLVQYYGEVDLGSVVEKKSTTHDRETSAPAFEILLASKKPPLEIPAQAPPIPQPESRGGSSTLVLPISNDMLLSETQDTLVETRDRNGSDSTKVFRNMSTSEDIDNEIDDRRTPAHNELPLQESIFDASGKRTWLVNPFTTAKLNTRLTPTKVEGTSERETLSARRDPNTSSDAISRSIDQQSLEASSPLQDTSPNHIHYLPTPGKSPSNTPYQNPGPPLRRRQGRLDEDDGCNIDDQGIASRAISPKKSQALLKAWMQLKQSTTSPSDDPNNEINHNSRETPVSRQVSEQTYLTKGREMTTSPSCVSGTGGINRPFKSPVRNDFGSMISKSDHGNTSSRSPFTSRPSLNRQSLQHSQDLDQIMEFEHRKKALNQKRQYVQPTVNPAELIRVQNDVLHGGASDPMDSTIRTRAPRCRKTTIQDDYATRFASEGILVSPPKSNVHQNRYLAATRHIDARALQNSQLESTGKEPNQPFRNVQQESANSTLTTAKTATLATYVPEVSSQSIHNVSNTNYNTKPQRKKSSPFPFETIPPGTSKHNLQMLPRFPFPDKTTLTKHYSHLAVHDRYIKTGKNGFQKWDPYSPQVSEWETKLEELIHTLYRARMIGPNTSSEHSTNIDEVQAQDVSPKEVNGGEGTNPTIKISLCQAIKVHIEAITTDITEHTTLPIPRTLS